MKSKTAFFNKGICLNYLKRCWPLWLGYLVIVLLVIPGGILPSLDSVHIRGEESLFWHILDMNRMVLRTGRDAITLSIFSGLAAAMTMFSFMYNSRSVSMMCALPVRREALFITAFVTGLAPMLITDVLAVALTAVPALGSGYVDAVNLWRLLGMLLMSNVAFYCFAVFCAVLTGNIVMLPVVYAVLNVAAVLAEQAVRLALDYVVYGFATTRSALTGFSPFVAATDWFYPDATMERVVENGRSMMRETGEFTVDHYHVLLIYCLVGLALVALALYIYRRRNMECAGDVVAVPLLRPIFRYCMCFGVAFCFAVISYSNVFSRVSSGFGTALVMLMLLLTGAFIGYFAAEMLMQKSLRVFRGRWMGYIVSAALLTAFIFTAELDLTGYEKRIPAVSDIENVSLGYYEAAELEQEASLEAVTAYHALLIDEKKYNEETDYADMLSITYTLKDGSQLKRSYPISREEDRLADENSSINRLFPVVNLQEAIDKRAATEIPVTEKTVQNGMLNYYYVDENGQYHHSDLELSEAQISELYNECILPDAAAGRLKRLFPVNNEEYYSFATTATVSFELMSEEHEFYWYDFVMYMDAARCRSWIAENTGIELLPIKEADWQQYENDEIYKAYYGIVVREAAPTRAAG